MSIPRRAYKMRAPVQYNPGHWTLTRTLVEHEQAKYRRYSHSAFRDLTNCDFSSSALQHEVFANREHHYTAGVGLGGGCHTAGSSGCPQRRMIAMACAPAAPRYVAGARECAVYISTGHCPHRHLRILVTFWQRCIRMNNA